VVSNAVVIDVAHIRAFLGAQVGEVQGV
jgi:hypothetical protein